MILHNLSIAHCAVLSQLHEESFDEAWTEKSFQDLVGMPATFGFLMSDEAGDPLGFILCQGDEIEAEIIAIATRSKVRRSGIARQLLNAAINKTQRMFLEVAEDNQGAIIFYQRHGFKQIARRKNYYKKKGKLAVDALVMEKVIH